jgi:transcriptional regulator with XRE-family HTH domain
MAIELLHELCLSFLKLIERRSRKAYAILHRGTSKNMLTRQSMSAGRQLLRIKQLRQQQGLTQRQLAEETGVDFSYLSKIENERLVHTPSIKMLQDLARVLQVDDLELMDLANKVPQGFEAIARDKAATRFFRRAAETVKSSEEWRDLLDYLERRRTVP